MTPLVVKILLGVMGGGTVLLGLRSLFLLFKKKPVVSQHAINLTASDLLKRQAASFIATEEARVEAATKKQLDDQSSDEEAERLLREAEARAKR